MRIRRSRREYGQSALEMALTSPLVFAIILGCLELGFAFNAYVTVTNAAREGARAGALYVYDSGASRAANDQNRESGTGTATSYTENIRDTVAGSMGILKNVPPNFDRNTDVTITYNPSTPTLDTRRGDLVSVRVVYRYPLLTKVVSDQPTLTLRAEASARIE